MDIVIEVEQGDVVGAKHRRPKSAIRGYKRNRITSRDIAIICRCEVQL